MSATEYFERNPVYTAQRKFKEGKGVSSNPFEAGTIPHSDFKAEIERLTKEKKEKTGEQ